MTEEMVERVAEAICIADCGRITANELDRCRDLAFAAIAALFSQWRDDVVERLTQRLRDAEMSLSIYDDGCSEYWLRHPQPLPSPPEEKKP